MHLHVEPAGNALRYNGPGEAPRMDAQLDLFQENHPTQADEIERRVKANG